MTGYKTRVVGAANTLEHRVFVGGLTGRILGLTPQDSNGKVVSPFHDIPLYANEEKTILNMVVEIPRWSNAKLEISKDEPFNPIKQDVKKGKLRYVRNCFPHHGYIWNYGAFPQVHMGGPLAPKLNDIEDVEKHLPGLLRATNEWFRIYKIPDGKPENNFAFNGEAKNRKYATEVVEECREAWHKLISQQIPNKSDNYNVATVNTSVSDSPYRVETSDAQYTSLPAASPQPAAPLEPSVHKWFFISGQPNL
ncbi:Inorganic pyrophosphatase [Rhizophlyctis rosea]|nr:Inorganic pyrophosphatase [Rhizophlyctis rosea]